jgi:polysaccharide biosynthesis transport protein
MTEHFEFDSARARLGLAEPAREMPPLAVEVDGAEEPHLLDYVKVVHKRRWLVGTVYTVIMLAVTVYTFTVTPIYEGKTELLIEVDNPNVVNFKEVIDEQQSKADYYQTQYKLLQSRSLAKKTVEGLKLWNNEEFGIDARGPRISISERVAGLFGRKLQAPAPSEPDETQDQAKVIDRFLDRLNVAPVRNSRLVDVTFRSRDARLAAQVTNAIARGYIEQSLEFKFMSSKEASDWLTEQLNDQRQKVEQSEAKLQEYREQNDALSLEQGQDITVQKLADLNAAVTRAKTLRIEREAIYRQIAAIQNNPAALDAFPAILSNGFIQQQKSELASLQRQLASLSEKFGDKHPDIIRIKSAVEIADSKLRGEVAKVVQSVKNDFLAAQTQERSMVAALEQQKGEALGLGKKGIEYGVLQRDAESNRLIYNSLLQRAKETSVSGELKTSNIRVVDPAETPVSPVSPKRALNMLIALFGGGFLAFGLAFFFEYLDNRIKTPDELKQHLGLPSLGLVPVLKNPSGHQPLISNSVPADFAEAFRTIRTNVLFSSADEGARTVVVTSTGPGEGKTTITANLAIGFAQAGQRVLLIDADMRRPRVHEILTINQEPGLSNLMVGTAKAGHCVRRTSIANLWTLPAGKIPPNPAELLGSLRFREFIKSLGQHFEWVIVDSPPVMAVADATILANLATGVVFVVGSDMTSRHGAKAALDQLEHARARFIGAVLNKVDLEGNPYYYSRYYRKEYARYYVKTGTHA